MKKGPVGLVALFILMASSVFAEEPLLRFQGKIGVSAKEGWWGWMSFVAFSPDGRMVASDGPITSSDRTRGLTLWSFPEGRMVKHIPFHPAAIADTWQYYASDRGVIDIASGTVLRKGDARWSPTGFSADGQYVALVGSGRPWIRVQRMADGGVVSEFGRRAVFSVAFHPDATLLASGHWDNITLWDVRTGERLALLQGFGRYVTGIRFSPDGKLLAAGTDSGGLRIWDVANRTPLHVLDLQGGDVSTPAFSPDGRLVAAGVYGTGTAFVIDVATAAIRDRAHVSDMGCGSVAFSPDGRYLITPSTGGLITWPHDRAGTIRVFQVGSDGTHG